jgi:hypothetical protein
LRLKRETVGLRAPLLERAAADRLKEMTRRVGAVAVFGCH